MELNERVTAILEAVRVELAPDPRLAVFEIAYEISGGRLILAGATSVPAAAEALHRRLALLDAAVEVRDGIVRLPHVTDGLPAHALVTAAVAPIVGGPLVADAQVSQAVLGQRLRVLRERNRWVHCCSDDGYLGWVHRGYLRRVDETTARDWEIGAGGEVCVSLGARVRDARGETLSPLPWGARFLRRGDRAVLPDGREGTAEGEWMPLAERGLRFPRRGEAVVETAAGWLGAPYLWSGITPSGVDCSGLVQAVYRMHGVRLPRDSDMQARTGELVEPGRAFSRLRPGDLLFFAEEPHRITHVALSLGGPRILHSSLGNGGVRRNDLTGENPYEQELRRLFVRARRVL